MEKSVKKDLIAYSSGWVSALLNFFPGLGVGYIYQRRWRAYWVTTIVSSLWLIIGFYNQLGIDPSDPIQPNNDLTSLLGLFLIASITAFEAWFTASKAKQDSLQNLDSRNT